MTPSTLTLAYHGTGGNADDGGSGLTGTPPVPYRAIGLLMGGIWMNRFCQVLGNSRFRLTSHGPQPSCEAWGLAGWANMFLILPWIDRLSRPSRSTMSGANRALKRLPLGAVITGKPR